MGRRAPPDSAARQCRQMLGEARLLGLDRVLIICEAHNIASARTIEHNAGVLEDVRDTGLGAVRRYWIKIQPTGSAPLG
jgi:predicted acetyltransferase